MVERVVRRAAAALTPERRAGQSLLVLCLAAHAFVIPRGAQHNVDSRLALTYALVERGTLSVEGYADQTIDRAVRDGRTYSDKAPGVSLWLAPLYTALRLLPLPDAGLPASERFVTRYLLTFIGLGVPHAAFAVWLFHHLRQRLPLVWPRLAVILGYALGTPAYLYAVHAYGHVPAGVCLYGGAILVGANHRRLAALGGALLAASVAFEYPTALPAALLAGTGLLSAGGPSANVRRRAVSVGAGTIPVLLGLALYHTAAFGAPWNTGYAFVDPSGPFGATHTTGVAGIGVPRPVVALELLAGAHRGLLTVAPWLMLAVVGGVLVWRTSHRDLSRAALVFLPLLAVNAGYTVWDGGASWGPRHLVAALPFLPALALPAAARWPVVAWALVAISIALTCAAVATGTMPPPGVSAVGDFLLPALNRGQIGNTLGSLAGLEGWRALAALAAVALGCWCWVAGLLRAYGLAVTGTLALLAAARLDTRYAEYAEGYYLYLASRLAAGVTLYRDAASTQTPGAALVASALWQALPGVYAPRVAALSCYFLSAVLAGKLATRLAGRGAGPPAALIAAVLPLGASAPQTFDANALLAPLAPALALCLAAVPARAATLIRASLIAAAGIACKLTFAPLVLAPLLVAPRRTWGVVSLTLALVALGWIALLVWAGPKARDALTGELESPLLPAGALLAALQFVRLEGAALLLAGVAFWRLGRDETLAPVHAVAVAAGLLPLLALHQGTFVSVARPAEPLLAAYAGAAVVLINASLPRFRALTQVALLACVVALPAFDAVRPSQHTQRPTEAPLAWVERYARPGESVLAPPFYAAQSGREMLFDYADLTVLGMRAASGVEPERSYASELVDRLARGALPFVIADFRLAYIPGAWDALQMGYMREATDGEGPLEVDLWLPRSDVAR